MATASICAAARTPITTTPAQPGRVALTSKHGLSNGPGPGGGLDPAMIAR